MSLFPTYVSIFFRAVVFQSQTEKWFLTRFTNRKQNLNRIDSSTKTDNYKQVLTASALGMLQTDREKQKATKKKSFQFSRVLIWTVVAVVLMADVFACPFAAAK